MEAQAFQALDDAMKEFHADPEAIYWTERRMGGYGVRALAYKCPDNYLPK